MPSEISKFVKTIGFVNQVFKPLLVKHNKIKHYRTVARPALTYGSEAWINRKADERKLQAAEMKFVRKNRWIYTSGPQNK
jgi:hypothetical protein